MNIDVSLSHNIHYLKISGRWDAFTTAEFEATVNKYLETESMRLVVLDMAGVEYISSFGLRSLLALGRNLEALGGALEVAALQPMVERVFLGCGFGRLFPVFPSPQEAGLALSRRL